MGVTVCVARLLQKLHGRHRLDIFVFCVLLSEYNRVVENACKSRGVRRLPFLVCYLILLGKACKKRAVNFRELPGENNHRKNLEGTSGSFK